MNDGPVGLLGYNLRLLVFLLSIATVAGLRLSRAAVQDKF